MNHMTVPADRRTDAGSNLRLYVDTIRLLERLHRQFLEVVKIELERAGIDEANNVQALMLFGMGDDEMSVGELTNRGHYLGTNVSYNLRKLVASGHIEQRRAPNDRRSIHVRITEKGRQVRAVLVAMFERQAAAVATVNVAPVEIEAAGATLGRIEKMLLLAERGRL